jgi:hypothetical protein
MEEQLELSPQDERYLNSPSFEIYMIAGAVFALGMTLSFVLTVMIHREPLFWPGLLLSIVVSSIVLQKLRVREYHAKLREIKENPIPQKKSPQR